LHYRLPVGMVDRWSVNGKGREVALGFPTVPEYEPLDQQGPACRCA
jgi:hypothetical protein